MQAHGCNQEGDGNDSHSEESELNKKENIGTKKRKHPYVTRREIQQNYNAAVNISKSDRKPYLNKLLQLLATDCYIKIPLSNKCHFPTKKQVASNVKLCNPTYLLLSYSQNLESETE